jgi:hypothetical protein
MITWYRVVHKIYVLFYSCIEKWLSSSANSLKSKCPQCNAPAKKSDVRILFTKSVVTMDSDEKEKLAGEIQSERRLRLDAESRETQLQMTNQMLKSELEWTQNKLKEAYRKIKRDKSRKDAISIDDTGALHHKKVCPEVRPNYAYQKTFTLSSSDVNLLNEPSFDSILAF